MIYKVPFVNFGGTYKKYQNEYDSAYKRIMESGQLILQDDGEKFEQEVADYLGVQYAVALNSCTDALYFAAKYLGIGPGDEVITVSHTFIATISHGIAHLGATPILVDIGDNGLIDVEKIESVITPKTKAIIPVHLEGNTCDMERILEIAEKYNLKVIEDSAQAFGAEIKGKKVGTFGDAGCWSFYPAKLLGGRGDGGMLTTNDKEMYEQVKKWRHHSYIGKNLGAENDSVDFGWNSRLDNLDAAFLRVALSHVSETIKRRKEIADYYNENLKGITGLILPEQKEGRVYQDYVVRSDQAAELVSFLTDNGIQTLGSGLMPNHHYKGLGLDFHLPKTDEYLAEQLRLPCNETLTNEDIRLVVQKVKEFYYGF